MEVLKIVLTIVFIVVSLALLVVVLMQEGKSAGLGAVAGAAETYWGKNKSRSMEGAMVRITRIMAILFMVLAVVLNMKNLNYVSSAGIRTIRNLYLLMVKKGGKLEIREVNENVMEVFEMTGLAGLLNIR